MQFIRPVCLKPELHSCGQYGDIMEKRISIIPVVLIFALITEIFLSVAFSERMLDAFVQGGNLLGIHVEDAKVYNGTVDHYVTEDFYTDLGDLYHKRFAVVIYEDAEGRKLEVCSNLTNEERGDPLPAQVYVLDNGDRVWIKEDLDAMRKNARFGLIIAGIKLLIPAAVVILCIISHKIRKKERETDYY